MRVNCYCEQLKKKKTKLGTVCEFLFGSWKTPNTIVAMVATLLGGNPNYGSHEKTLHIAY